MKKFVLALLLVPALWVSAHAQNLTTADEVINKYLNAIGGKEALKKIKDMSQESSFTNSGGNYTSITKHKLPNNKLLLVKDTTGKIIYQQVIDGKQVSTKFGDNMIPTKPEDLQRILLGGQWIPELTLKEKNVQYTLAGKETVNGRETYKINYTGADGNALWTAYYDAQTGLLARTLTSFQDGPQTGDYSDYREFMGIKLPYHFNGYGSVTQKIKYEANTGFSDAEFVIQ